MGRELYLKGKLGKQYTATNSPVPKTKASALFSNTVDKNLQKDNLQKDNLQKDNLQKD
jgi:hypothetical protein